MNIKLPLGNKKKGYSHMLGNKNPNIQMIESMMAKLGALSDDMVFLGGCATGLLTTETGVVLPRVTVDMDAIVEVASLGDHHNLSEK